MLDYWTHIARPNFAVFFKTIAKDCQDIVIVIDRVRFHILFQYAVPQVLNIVGIGSVNYMNLRSCHPET